MTSSLPVLWQKENVSYTRDYNKDIHEKIKSKSALLKICTKFFFAALSNLSVVKRKRTVFYCRANFQQSTFWFIFFVNISIIVPFCFIIAILMKLKSALLKICTKRFFCSTIQSTSSLAEKDCFYCRANFQQSRFWFFISRVFSL